MRDWIDTVTKLNEADEPHERKFYIREIEAPNGTWVWQHGMTSMRDADKIMWAMGTFKTAKGAIDGAQRRYMNPNTKHEFTSAFFRNPTIAERLPLVMGNPFYEG